MKRPWMLIVAAVSLLAAAAPALAGPGFHVGLSLDPDNVLAGLHWKGKPVAENLHFVPSVEVGFGDVTMIAGNADLHYTFETSSDLAPYAGGGLTINWFDTNGGSDTEIGGSILGGIELNPKMFLEAKLGLGDVPDFKVYIGFHRP